MSLLKFDIGAELDIASGDEIKQLDKKMTGLFRGGKKRAVYKPVSYSTQVAASGVAVPLNVGGPAAGKVWDVRQLLVVTDDRTSAVAVSNTIGAAAAGSAVLPAGASVTGFSIWCSNAAAVVNGLATLQGLTGGNVNYQITMTTSGTTFAASFTPPLSASSASQAISIFVAAITGGSAYTVEIYGVLPAPWYVGWNDSVGIGTLLVPGSQSVVGSSYVPAGTESIFLHFGETFTSLVYGLAAGQSVTAIARVAEWDDGDWEMATI